MKLFLAGLTANFHYLAADLDLLSILLILKPKLER
jgi:hypothetical protein